MILQLLSISLLLSLSSLSCVTAEQEPKDLRCRNLGFVAPSCNSCEQFQNVDGLETLRDDCLQCCSTESIIVSSSSSTNSNDDDVVVDRRREIMYDKAKIVACS